LKQNRFLVKTTRRPALPVAIILFMIIVRRMTQRVNPAQKEA